MQFQMARQWRCQSTNRPIHFFLLGPVYKDTRLRFAQKLRQIKDNPSLRFKGKKIVLLNFFCAVAQKTHFLISREILIQYILNPHLPLFSIKPQL